MAALAGLTFQAMGQVNAFLSPEEAAEDLDTLFAWVLAMHPLASDEHVSHDLQATHKSARQMFGAGVPAVMFPVAVHKLLSPISDVHTGIDWGTWSRSAATEAGRFPGAFEVVSRDGDVLALDEAGNILPEHEFEQLKRHYPKHFEQGLSPQWSPATLGQRTAAIAPAWLPLLSGERGFETKGTANASSSAFALTAGLGWQMAAPDTLFIACSGFDADSWRAYRQQCRKLRKDILQFQPRHIVLDLRGNGGGEQARAMMLASLLSGQEVRFHESTKVRGSHALRVWAKDQIPLGRRLFLPFRRANSPQVAYAKAMLHTPPGELAELETVHWPARPNDAASSGLEIWTDGLTASAAAVLASWLRKAIAAPLVGIPPYGLENSVCGNAIALRLPNSGIPIRVATTCWTSTGPATPMEIDIWRFEIARDSGLGDKQQAFLDAMLENMSSADSGFSPAMVSRFSDGAPAILKAHQARMSALKARQLELETLSPVDASELPQSVGELMNDLLAERQQAKDARDAALRLLLPIETWPTFDALLNPPRPAVLHFGIHDRMNCNVCIPE